MVKNLPANAGDTGSIPGSGRASGEGKGNPLQYSCLGNSMDRRGVGPGPDVFQGGEQWAVGQMRNYCFL